MACNIAALPVDDLTRGKYVLVSAQRVPVLVHQMVYSLPGPSLDGDASPAPFASPSMFGTPGAGIGPISVTPVQAHEILVPEHALVGYGYRIMDVQLPFVQVQCAGFQAVQQLAAEQQIQVAQQIQAIRVDSSLISSVRYFMAPYDVLDLRLVDFVRSSRAFFNRQVESYVRFWQQYLLRLPPFAGDGFYASSPEDKAKIAEQCSKLRLTK